MKEIVAESGSIKDNSYKYFFKKKDYREAFNRLSHNAHLDQTEKFKVDLSQKQRKNLKNEIFAVDEDEVVSIMDRTKYLSLASICIKSMLEQINVADDIQNRRIKLSKAEYDEMQEYNPFLDKSNHELQEEKASTLKEQKELEATQSLALVQSSILSALQEIAKKYNRNPDILVDLSLIQR